MIDIKRKYNLSDKDFYHTEDGSVIIRRTGIKKIRESANIDVTYEVEGCGSDWCVMLATGSLHVSNESSHAMIDGATTYKKAQSIGSATPKNCSFTFVHEVAEYRAEARVVLELIGLKKDKVFSEDEMSLEKQLKNGIVDKAKKMSVAGVYRGYALTGAARGAIGDIVDVGEEEYVLKLDGSGKELKLPVSEVLRWSVSDHPYMRDKRSVSEHPKIIKLLGKKGITSSNYKEFAIPKYRVFTKLISDGSLIEILQVISNKINN